MVVYTNRERMSVSQIAPSPQREREKEREREE